MFDAYEVAVRLRLKDEFTGVMGLIGKQLMHANKHAEELQGRLDKIMGHFKMGAMVTTAGFGMAMTLKAATNEAVKYEQQMNRLRALNLDTRFGKGTTASLVQQAMGIAQNTRGTTSMEALKLVTEAQAITGDVEHTKALAPILARMRYGMDAYMAANGKVEKEGGGAANQFASIVKVMELRGLMRNFSEAKLDRMADLFVKNYVASGGMVKPSDYLALMKIGGIATKSVDPTFMFAFGHIMQEMGGRRSGRSLMSLYQNMVAGRMPQQVAETLNHLGLLDRRFLHYGTTGHITKVDPGAMKDSSLLVARPDLYMQQVILPALAKHGVDINNKNQVLQALNTLAGQRTATNLLGQLYLERNQIANYMAQAENAKGVNAMYAQGSKSTVGMQMDVLAKVIQLELDFGKAELPLLKSVLEQEIPLVKSLGSWMDKHPTGLKDLATGFGLLAASMMISGPLMMLTSGMRALAVVTPLLAGGIGKLNFISGAFLARLGAVGLAAYGGYKAGTYANGEMSKFIRWASNGNSNSLGDWIGNMTHDSAAEHEAQWKAHMEALLHARQQNTEVHTSINIDGRKVAHAVTRHQVAAASRPSSMQSGFDGSMSMRPVGAN